MKVILQPGGARAFWKASLPDEAVGLAWLGQAGFALRHAGRLRMQTIDLALLPVNGRSDRLTSRGIMGNMTFDEAQALCVAAGIGAWVPHHFGMFAFNTADPAELLSRVARPQFGLRCLLPSLEHYLVLESAISAPNQVRP